jgi:transcriptional regulator with XRE-family HTH domain
MATLDNERGKRLRLIRKSFGETQAEFGSRFAKTGPAVSNYERGRLPEDEILKALFQMGFSIDWLLSGEGSMHRYGRSGGRIDVTRSPSGKSEDDKAIGWDTMESERFTSEIGTPGVPFSDEERKLIRVLKVLLQEIIRGN